LNLGKELGQPSRQSFLEIDSLQGLVTTALEGIGIIEAPNDPTVLSTGLIRVLRRKRGPQFKMHYVFSNKRQQSKKINLLFEYLQR
jgi:DNA-binding transcriptional LysR family regulator